MPDDTTFCEDCKYHRHQFGESETCTNPRFRRDFVRRDNYPPCYTINKGYCLGFERDSKQASNA